MVSVARKTSVHPITLTPLSTVPKGKAFCNCSGDDGGRSDAVVSVKSSPCTGAATQIPRFAAFLAKRKEEQKKPITPGWSWNQHLCSNPFWGVSPLFNSSLCKCSLWWIPANTICRNRVCDYLRCSYKCASGERSSL